MGARSAATRSFGGLTRAGSSTRSSPPETGSSSALAGGAEPRAAAGDSCLLDGSPAARARLATPPVDLELMLHPPRLSVRRPVVTQRRALSCDSRFECATNTPMERAYFWRLELIRRPTRVDPRPPESLVGVDVPHAGERPLVEENAFHRATTLAEPPAEIAAGKARPERLDA